MSGKLEGKVALVTGAANGQGAATARLFAAEGAKVVLTDVAEDAGRRVAEEINAAGGAARFFRLDVATESDWTRVLPEVRSAFGGLHVLINNAGVISRKKIVDMGAEDWHRVMNVNLTGALFGMKHCAPIMRDCGGGAIVNVSSIGGLMAHFDAAYGASKWGLRGLTKSAAIEFVDWKIRVNSIHPGQIENTSFVAQAVPGHVETTRKVIPMGRQGTPEETAKLMLFLSCDDSSFITGAEIAIDGGFSAGAIMRVRAMLTEQLARSQS